MEEEAVTGAEAAAVAEEEEDDGDNRTTKRKDYENKTKQCDFIDNERVRRSDPRMQLSRAELYWSGGEKAGGSEAGKRTRNARTRAKAIRYAETGGRRPHPGCNKL